MGLQLPGDTDLVHALPKGLLHEVQSLPVVVRLFLLRHVVQIQITRTQRQRLVDAIRSKDMECAARSLMKFIEHW